MTQSTGTGYSLPMNLISSPENAPPSCQEPVFLALKGDSESSLGLDLPPHQLPSGMAVAGWSSYFGLLQNSTAVAAITLAASTIWSMLMYW